MKSILNYRKPVFWIIIVALVAGIAVGGYFIVNQRIPVEQTPNEQVGEKIKNEEFVFTKTYYRQIGGLWAADEFTYKYRLEITGRMINSPKNITYVVLSNTKDLTFEQIWKASGYSSSLSDYFEPKDVLIVGYRIFL
ncbi:MAG: hypothetical protein ACOYJX_05680 [Acutalibacteraceae bacterium]|jgi:hypothetical protein